MIQHHLDRLTGCARSYSFWVTPDSDTLTKKSIHLIATWPYLLTALICSALGHLMPFDHKLFEEIEADLAALDIDEIRQRLGPLTIGFVLNTPIFDPGTFLYRGRKLGPKFRKKIITLKDLIYPPVEKSRLGRLNRAGQPVFYAAMNKEAVFFELSELNAGDELIVIFWKTKQRMIVNNIGYTEYAFEQLGASRPLPKWNPKKPHDNEQTLSLATLPPEVARKAMSVDDARDLKVAFSKYFSRHVGDDETYRYKLTVAIGELHLGDIKNYNLRFAGLLYPSVRMWANGDNIALHPWFVDKHLEFRKAVHVRITERRETEFDIDYLDAAHEFDESGNLRWLGRMKNWTLKPLQGAQMVLEPGIDTDGDYSISKEGQPAHWVATDKDTGKIIEPG